MKGMLKYKIHDHDVQIYIHIYTSVYMHISISVIWNEYAYYWRESEKKIGHELNKPTKGKEAPTLFSVLFVCPRYFPQPDFLFTFTLIIPTHILL